MKELIKFQDVTISIGERILFDHLDLTINEGDRFILSGQNGTGKSLLLNLLADGYTNRIAKEYKGLKVKGEVLDANGDDLMNPKTIRSIAYAEQKESFYSNSTVFSEAETACHGSDIELDEDKLDYLLEKFGIEHLKKKRIRNQVSGGEGKIISLITRILKLPASDILLLDEPLNHLSFQNSKVFNEIMLEEIQAKPNLAIIMVSHCRAVNFVDKALMFEPVAKKLAQTSYTSYDCFSQSESDNHDS